MGAGEESQHDATRSEVRLCSVVTMVLLCLAWSVARHPGKATSMSASWIMPPANKQEEGMSGEGAHLHPWRLSIHICCSHLRSRLCSWRAARAQAASPRRAAAARAGRASRTAPDAMVTPDDAQQMRHKR